MRRNPALPLTFPFTRPGTPTIDASPNNPAGRTISLQKGDRIDAFVIEGRIGSGGFSQVYRAHDPLLNRHVAVKQVLMPDAADPEAARAAVMREADAQRKAAAADPDLLVQLIDVVDDPRGLMLISQYVDGQSLETLLQANPAPADPRKALGIIAATAKALHAIHSQQLLHRDLKPANILIPNNGGLKITDFGLAAAIAEQQSMNLGSVRYLAPELLRGEPGDPRSDLYSLGIVAYELLAGRAAFDDAFRSITRDQHNAAMRWMKWHTNPRARAQPLTKVNPDVPEPIAQLVERLMEKEPAKRVASATELLEAIRRQLVPNGSPSEPADTNASGVIDPNAPAPRPTPAEAAVAAATGAPLATAAPDTAALPKRSKLPLILAVTLGVWALAAVGFVVFTQQRTEQQREAQRADAETLLASAFTALQARNHPDAARQFADLTQQFADQPRFLARAQAGQALADAWVLYDNGEYLQLNPRIEPLQDQIRDLGDASGAAAEQNDFYAASARELRSLNTPRAATAALLVKIDDAIEQDELEAALTEIGMLRDARTTLEDAESVALIALLDQREARIQSIKDERATTNILAEANRRFRDGRNPDAAIKYLSAQIANAGRRDVTAERARLAEYEQARTVSRATTTAQRKDEAARRADTRAAYDDAVRAWKEAKELTEDDDIDARIADLESLKFLAIGRAAVEANQIPEAREAFGQSLAAKPNAAARAAIDRLDAQAKRVALLAEGDQLLSAGDFNAAIAKYREAGDANTQIAAAENQRTIKQGNDALARGEFAIALERFQNAALGDPDNRELPQQITDLEARIEFENLLTQARSALTAKRFGDAKARVREAGNVLGDAADPTLLARMDRINTEAEYGNWFAEGRRAQAQGRNQDALAAYLVAWDQLPTPEVRKLIEDLGGSVPALPDADDDN
ncbi:MAG: serine/threonine-protein kinase [Planctomycetota bacterium]